MFLYLKTSVYFRQTISWYHALSTGEDFRMSLNGFGGHLEGDQHQELKTRPKALFIQLIWLREHSTAFRTKEWRCWQLDSTNKSKLQRAAQFPSPLSVQSYLSAGCLSQQGFTENQIFSSLLNGEKRKSCTFEPPAWIICLIRANSGCPICHLCCSAISHWFNKTKRNRDSDLSHMKHDNDWAENLSSILYLSECTHIRCHLSLIDAFHFCSFVLLWCSSKLLLHSGYFFSLFQH